MKNNGTTKTIMSNPTRVINRDSVADLLELDNGLTTVKSVVNAALTTMTVKPGTYYVCEETTGRILSQGVSVPAGFLQGKMRLLLKSVEDPTCSYVTIE